MQGKTSIDKLSLLVSGRIRVTVDGEFLHYIFPFQFLDSPEWDSLKPTEEGIFQVTLTAETDCRYVSWRRKKLYLLLAQHRYISRLFSVLIGSDIADKLYALNDRVYIGKRYHYDIRLPNFYQMSSPEMSRSTLTEHFQNSRRHCDKWHRSLQFYNDKRLSSSLPEWKGKIQKIELTNIFLNPTQRRDAAASCFIHLNVCIVKTFYKFFFCISHWNIWGGAVSNYGQFVLFCISTGRMKFCVLKYVLRLIQICCLALLS